WRLPGKGSLLGRCETRRVLLALLAQRGLRSERLGTDDADALDLAGEDSSGRVLHQDLRGGATDPRVVATLGRRTQAVGEAAGRGGVLPCLAVHDLQRVECLEEPRAHAAVVGRRARYVLPHEQRLRRAAGVISAVPGLLAHADEAGPPWVDRHRLLGLPV